MQPKNGNMQPTANEVKQQEQAQQEQGDRAEKHSKASKARVEQGNTAGQQSRAAEQGNGRGQRGRATQENKQSTHSVKGLGGGLLQ